MVEALEAGWYRLLPRAGWYRLLPGGGVRRGLRPRCAVRTAGRANHSSRTPRGRPRPHCEEEDPSRTAGPRESLQSTCCENSGTSPRNETAFASGSPCQKKPHVATSRKKRWLLCCWPGRCARARATGPLVRARCYCGPHNTDGAHASPIGGSRIFRTHPPPHAPLRSTRERSQSRPVRPQAGHTSFERVQPQTPHTTATSATHDRNDRTTH